MISVLPTKANCGQIMNPNHRSDQSTNIVGVPVFHIHGNSDTVVPLEANSAELAKRYREYGGPIKIEVVEGQGHNMWEGWFTSQRLTDFVIARALGRPVNVDEAEADARDSK